MPQLRLGKRGEGGVGAHKHLCQIGEVVKADEVAEFADALQGGPQHTAAVTTPPPGSSTAAVLSCGNTQRSADWHWSIFPLHPMRPMTQWHHMTALALAFHHHLDLCLPFHTLRRADGHPFACHFYELQAK